jgi:hypothetical protein
MRNMSKYRLIGLGILAGTAIIATGCGSGSSSTATSLVATSSLTLSASTSTIGFDGYVQFTATGGASPYTYTIVSPNGYAGQINSSSGYYIAPSSNETVGVQATDSSGATAVAYITVSSSASGSVSDQICTSYSQCESLLALSIPIDGSYEYAASNANAACEVLNHGTLVTYQTQNISISCGNLYTLADWNGGGFVNESWQICQYGYATVLSSITCSE